MTIDQIVNSLSADAHWQVTKVIGRTIGIELAVMLSELVYKYRYWQARRQLDNMGGFFMSSQDLQDVLGIAEGAVKRMTRQIQESGVVKVKKRGVPAKNYWYIQWDKVGALLEMRLTSEVEIDLTGEAETGLTGEVESSLTITNKSLPTKKTKVQAMPDGLYSEIVDVFSKGYEALEKQKLSWVGKEKAYGAAVKTIIKQAQSVCGEGASRDVLKDEIQGRARAFIKAVSHERSLIAKGSQGNKWLAKKSFTPTYFMAVWNEFAPAAKIETGPVRAPTEIPADELARHREASGV